MRFMTITTFQRAHNYGAMLQALALQNVLENKGFEVRFLDYKDVNIEAPYRLFPLKGKKGIEALKTILRSVRYIEPNIIRRHRFLTFQEKKLHLEKKKTDFFADYYITGSDQVWNSDITNGLSDIYTLNFGRKDVKRISYGASIGKGQLSVEEQTIFQNKLQYMNSISVREETAKKLLEEIFPNKHISVVLDPTLLLTREEWGNLLEGIKVQNNKKYILAYMVEENQEFRKIAKNLEEKTGYPIFHFEKKNFWKNAKSFYTAGVLEFVNYIKNAEYVVTTSFHATVFSIIFNKKFWIIPHEVTGSRVIDLVNSLELSNRIVNTLDMFLKVDYNEDINYERVDKILDIKRKQSLQWLENEVKEKNE